MALLESTRIPLGTKMPSFILSDPGGTSWSSAALLGEKGLLVVFTCNHCPYAKAIWGRVISLARHAEGLGINTVAINPNINPDYPADAPPKMKELAAELGLAFPYLVDEDQETARAYQAQCTPDIYLLGGEGQLAYHGRIDDNWQDEAAVTSEELREALDSLGAGRPIALDQQPSIGCSIKWLAKG